MQDFDLYHRFDLDCAFFPGIVMLLNLTDLSHEPLQGQIVRQIRAKILAGEMVAGADLPSIRKLARDNHISVITVQRAYETLENGGLIHSRRGKGFFVTELSDQTRRRIAEGRLREILDPIMRGSLAEGLSKEEIRKNIDHLLKDI